MLKTSTTTAELTSIVGDRKAIEMIAKAGFDGVDYNFGMVGWDWYKDDIFVLDHPFTRESGQIEYAKELKKIASDNGVVFNQTHAPNPTKPPVEKWVAKTIEYASAMGSKYIIVHPYTADFEYNVNLFKKFLPIAKDNGIKIAIENIWHYFENGLAVGPVGCNEQSLYELIEILNSDNAVVCVDIGHACMAGLDTSPEKLILKLKDKVKCLHIHDNDLKKDLHLNPFEGDIDFSSMVSALKQIKYDGFLTLESILKGGENLTEQDVKIFLEKSYQAVDKLNKMF